MPNQKSKDKNKTIDQATVASSVLSLDDLVELLNSPTRIRILSFRAGIWRGLGFTLGAALAVVLMSLLVTLFGGWPVIGDFFRNINNAIQM